MHKAILRLTIWSSCFSLSGLLLAQEEPVSLGNGFELSVGVTARQFGNLRIQSGSTFQNQPLGRFVPAGQSLGDANAVGPLNEFADRTYEDGFVRIDAGTLVDGNTGWWGFQNASQISGDFLNLRSAPFFNTTSSTTTRTSTLTSDQDTGTVFGPEVEIGYRLRTTDRLVVRGVFGVSWSRVSETQTGSTFTQTQRSQSSGGVVQDSFSLGGILPPLAPFTGTEMGPGPVIPNLPASRTILPTGATGGQEVMLMNRVRDEVDLDIYTLSLGVDARQQLIETLSVTAGVGLALNLVDVSTSHSEDLFLSRGGSAPTLLQSRREANSSLETSWGYYAKGGLAWQFAETLSLYGYARYDWNESISGRVGPGFYSLDMDALSFGTGLRWDF